MHINQEAIIVIISTNLDQVFHFLDNVCILHLGKKIITSLIRVATLWKFLDSLYNIVYKRSHLLLAATAIEDTSKVEQLLLKFQHAYVILEGLV